MMNLSSHELPALPWQKLVTDSGPSFQSKKFKEFIQQWEITRVLPSPYMSTSNGMAESGVKIVGNTLKKGYNSGNDPHLALLHYRNAPKGDLSSPAQLLMSRCLRCTLPISETLLKPNIINFRKHISIARKKKNKSKEYFDRKCRVMSAIRTGDKVQYKLKPNGYWIPDVTVVKKVGIRSYLIRNREGSEYIRNTKFIPANLKPILRDSEHDRYADSYICTDKSLPSHRNSIVSPQLINSPCPSSLSYSSSGQS